MGIKLDWDIDSEQGRQRQHKEDPRNRRARYGGFLRLLLVVILFLGAIGGIAYGIYWRWNTVNDQLETVLTNTVQAEVAALRIGNYDEFMSFQRSADDEWLVDQTQRFDTYQRLKLEADVSLTGHILDTTIVDRRARVQVQEIIDGVPYVQTWFYWYYVERIYDDAGNLDDIRRYWAHVPPDYEFWGDAASISTERYTINYRTLDEAVAQRLAQHLTDWLDDGCALFDCARVTPLTVDIVTNNVPPIAWDERDPQRLIVRSPYRDRARADLPFDQQYQLDLATLLANRLVDTTMTVADVRYPTDAYYLRTSIVAWLTGRFMQLNPETHLIDSLINNYDRSILPATLRALQANATLSVLTQVTGTTTLTDVNADWRDFVGWRLQTEADLIRRSDEANWRTLYDLRDSSITAIAYDRFNANNPPAYRVLEAYITLNNALTPQLQARVQVIRGETVEEQLVLFNLVNGTWLRAS